MIIESIVLGLVAWNLIPESKPKKNLENNYLQRPAYFTFAIRLFEGKDTAELDKGAFSILMNALIALNIMEFKAYPYLSRDLLKSDVRYEKIQGRKDTPFKDVRGVYETKKGNCKNLVAIRVAEEWLKGNQDVTYELSQVIRSDGKQDWHVVLKKILPNGKVFFEDTSKLLGME
jgi:hypothetical protein